jgi:hypothetical protein
MAVFLLRSMYGSGYTPPSAAGIFDDVPVTHWAADWIEQLYDEGITSGCSTNPPMYCPDEIVNRAQMAVFIVRTFLGSPPPPGEWSGSAGFGELSFIVDSTSTGITEITYTLTDFSCGGVVRNGSKTSTREPPWPITDSQFTIETTFDPNFEMTLSGTFDETGTNASGSWEAISYGTICSGTWDASPL